MARPNNPDTKDVDEGKEADKEIKKFGEKLIKKGVD